MALQQPGTGYRDPAKTMTIKALQERQKAAADAAARATAIPEGPMSSPWQGVSHLTGVLSGQMQENRAAGQEADARARLAQVMSGIDPAKGASMAQIAEMQQLDPDFANKEYERMMTERSKIADREDTQTFEAGESQAERDARIAEQQQRQTFESGQQTERIGAEKANIGYKDTLEDENTKLADEAAAKKARLDAVLATNEGKRAELVAAGTMDAAEAARLNDLDRQKLEADLAGTEATTAATLGRPVTDEDIAKYPGINKEEFYIKGDHPELIQPQRNPGDYYTPGEKAEDELAAKELAEWASSGSFGAITNIKQMKEAIGLLSSGNITGFRQGLVAKTLPSWASSLLNPDGTTIAQSAIRETIASTLRQTLGAQFTQQEGENLMDRAFDPSLGEAENLRRANLLLDQVSNMALNKQAKLDYWRKNGSTVRGYKELGGENAMDTLRQLAESPAVPSDGTTPPPASGATDVDAIIKKAQGIQ